ncbi:hypothetical protein V8E51_010946 [Hyaloscypha variabilis]
MTTDIGAQAGPSSAQGLLQRTETSNAAQIELSPDERKCQCSASANQMASDLKDIRSFMISAMKSLDIPLPEQDATDLDLTNLKLNDSMYSETRVFDFWSARLPTGRLGLLCDEVLSVFTKNTSDPDEGFDPDILIRDDNSKTFSIVWKFDGHQKLANGSQDVLDIIRRKWPKRLGIVPDRANQHRGGLFMELFQWDVRNTEKDYMKLCQFSYDEEGYPLRILYYAGNENHYLPFIIMKQAIATSPPHPWNFQSFAAVWYLTLPAPILSFRWLALILSQFEDTYMHNADGVSSPAIRFVKRFTGPWPARKWSRWDYFTLKKRNSDAGVIQYHSRVFSPEKVNLARLSFDSVEGIVCTRSKGELPSLGTSIIERRFSVALDTTHNLELPTFVLVILSEFDNYYLPIHNQDRWEDAHILPCLECTGIAAFQFKIREYSYIWAQDWNNLLQLIDKALTVKLGDILTPMKREEMMFDNDPFPRSDLYFTVLQLLRISADWISESLKDLESLAEASQIMCEIFTKSPDKRRGRQDPVTVSVRTVLEQNWKNVISHQKSLAKPLLERIEKKTEEVKSLRDGLFNATAVREASRASKLNHYILVFTVMTILYLPLSFTAGLFALNLFQLEEPRQKTAFIVTIVLVALSTYLVSGYLVWFVRKEERRQMFRHLWTHAANGNAHGDAHTDFNIMSKLKDWKSLFGTKLQAGFASKTPNAAPETSDIHLNSLP